MLIDRQVDTPKLMLEPVGAHCGKTRFQAQHRRISMRILAKLSVMALLAGAYTFAMPLIPFTTANGFHAGVALADSRDDGHAKHDRGKDGGTSTGY
jgi:hypothetical protein